MILYLSIFTLILTVSLTFHNYKTNKNSLYLAGFLVPLSIYNILHYYLFEGNSILGIAIFFRHFSPLFYILGAMLYLYVRGSLKNDWIFSKQDLWHLLPLCVGLLNIVPYYFISFEQKLYFAEKVQQTSNFNQPIYQNLFYPFYISSIIRAVLFFGYVVASFFLLYGHWKNKQNQLIVNSKKNLFRWLIFLTSSALVLSICFIFLTFGFYINTWVQKSAITDFNYTLIAGLSFCLIPAVMIFYPQVVYGVPIAILSEKKKNKAEKLKQNHEKDNLVVLAEKIILHFEIDQPYLNKEFSLDDLSQHLGVPKHQIYTCLNSAINKKFTELRTSYRIEHAKKLLLSGDIDSISLQGIWMNSGFSSKTNFFTTFKEETGLTPIEFVQHKKVNTN